METTKEQPPEAKPAPESPAPESRSHGPLIALTGLPALPGLRQLSWLRPQVKLPSRDKVLLYTGLGAMAAIDLIDWPVAAAIAMATVLTSSGSRSQSLPEASLHPDKTPAGDETPPKPAPRASPKAPARRSRGQEA